MLSWVKVAGTVALLSGSAPALADGSLYRCSAHSIMVLGDGGDLERYPAEESLKKALSSTIVDTATGTIREGASTHQWRVIQQGSASGDFVATPGARLVDAVTDFIRIRAWKAGQPVTFFRVGLTMVITGSCEVVQ